MCTRFAVAFAVAFAVVFVAASSVASSSSMLDEGRLKDDPFHHSLGGVRSTNRPTRLSCSTSRSLSTDYRDLRKMVGIVKFVN